jgi:hypothetical protein
MSLHSDLPIHHGFFKGKIAKSGKPKAGFQISLVVRTWLSLKITTQQIQISG